MHQKQSCTRLWSMMMRHTNAYSSASDACHLNVDKVKVNTIYEYIIKKNVPDSSGQMLNGRLSH